MKKIVFICLLTFAFTSCRKDKVENYSNATCADTVSFNNEILPLIQNNCTGCHDNQYGYSLTNHSNISSNSAAIIGSMHQNGYQLMPQGGPALHDSIIYRIECWVNQGKLNN
jgi:PBP1b-binding outer membrane lipoprotein LpoB